MMSWKRIFARGSVDEASERLYLPDDFKIGAEVRMGPLLNFGFEVSRIL
jgi:hypothetical protein